MPEIKINEKIAIQSNDNESILDSILRNGYSHNYSCLNGRCNSCRVEILNGNTIKLNEETGLSLEDKESNYILSCSRSATENISIESKNFYETPPLKVNFIPSKIFSIKKFTNDIAELFLKIPNRLDFDFIPGQYLSLKYQNIERSYSILSYDHNNKILSILCKKIQQGLFSNYIFEKAKENDRIIIKGPLGMINIFQSNVKNYIFLATGVGISPIKSMLNSQQGINFFKNKKIIIFWGNRYKENFIYDFHQEMQLFNMNVFYCLSKKDSELNDCEFGYVQEIMMKKNISLEDSIIYACGSNDMINNAFSICKDNGFDMGFFYSDAFLESGIS